MTRPLSMLSPNLQLFSLWNETVLIMVWSGLCPTVTQNVIPHHSVLPNYHNLIVNTLPIMAASNLGAPDRSNWRWVRVPDEAGVSALGLSVPVRVAPRPRLSQLRDHSHPLHQSYHHITALTPPLSTQINQQLSSFPRAHSSLTRTTGLAPRVSLKTEMM